MRGEQAGAALIGAYEPAANAGGLQALSVLAGAPLAEHQALRAVAAGCTTVLLLADGGSGGLQALASRLRQDGVICRVVETIADAADALHPDERVLLIADGCLPQRALLEAAAAGAVPTLCVVPDTPEHAGRERIDAGDRWAGVALIDRRRIAETAAMVGNWDPVSTLLRRAVQEGAQRVAALPAPLLLAEPATLAAAEETILTEARRPADDLADRLIFKPGERLAVPLLLARGIEATALGAGGAALAIVAGLLSIAGWRWPALLALLLASLGRAASKRLARVRQRPDRWRGLMRDLWLTGAALAALGLARGLAAETRQWGWWLTGLLLIASTVAVRLEQRRTGASPPLWIASVDTLAWALVPLACLGRWGGGMAALTAYSAGSFLWLYLGGGRRGPSADAAP